MQVHDSLIELVGNTPLVRLRRVTRELGAGAPAVLAKVEYFNPRGSVKDRIALRMVEAAEASGELRPGGTAPGHTTTSAPEARSTLILSWPTLSGHTNRQR